MPRAKLIRQSEFPYNISARCINREWFNIPMDEVWDIFCKVLDETIKRHNLVVHSFVLMSNHFHLIASTPNENVDICMHHFMYWTSRHLTKKGNRINQTYAGRHYKTILQHPSYYLNAYKYNYRNPVTAGICNLVEEYKYSTLQHVLNKVPLKFKLVQDTTFDCDPTGTLAWLNTQPEPKKLEAVRWGLKHQYFKSKKCRSSRKLIMDEEEIL
jgi:putative transposase